jgi:F420-0:gamma-glutamyl ligase-like protein
MREWYIRMGELCIYLNWNVVRLIYMCEEYSIPAPENPDRTNEIIFIQIRKNFHIDVMIMTVLHNNVII